MVAETTCEAEWKGYYQTSILREVVLLSLTFV